MNMSGAGEGKCSMQKECHEALKWHLVPLTSLILCPEPSREVATTEKNN